MVKPLAKNSLLSRRDSVLVLIKTVCLAVCVALAVVGCRRRSTPPDVPIYPQSVLVDQTEMGVETSNWPLVTYEYTSSDTLEEIISFYREASCEKIGDPQREMCQGEAVPFGEYVVYFDMDQTPYAADGLAYYVVEVRWRGVPTN